MFKAWKIGTTIVGACIGIVSLVIAICGVIGFAVYIALWGDVVKA